MIGLVGNGDISIYVGFAVSGLAYYALMRDRIGTRAQTLEDPAQALVSQPHPSIGTAIRSDTEESS